MTVMKRHNFDQMPEPRIGVVNSWKLPQNQPKISINQMIAEAIKNSGETGATIQNIKDHINGYFTGFAKPDEEKLNVINDFQ